MAPEVYLWLKAGHIIAVIAWMAGLLYLPRLYAYHCQVEPGSAESDRFELMERRLLRVIVNPAMVASFALGVALLAVSGIVDWSEGWIYLKLALVAVLAGAHGMFALWRRDFAAGRNRHGERFYRRVNEVPTVLLIGIVILAVVKPF